MKITKGGFRREYRVEVEKLGWKVGSRHGSSFVISKNGVYLEVSPDKDKTWPEIIIAAEKRRDAEIERKRIRQQEENKRRIEEPSLPPLPGRHRPSILSVGLIIAALYR